MGPRTPEIAAATGGALLVAGGAIYAGIQKVSPIAKKQATQLLAKWRSRAQGTDALSGSVFTITTAAESDKGVSFTIGDRFRVLEREADAVLIELIGNDKQPLGHLCWALDGDL